MTHKGKWYVVNRQTISIVSEHPTWLAASEAVVKCGGSCKVQTQPQVGGVKLDPADPASWKPKRQNPGVRENSAPPRRQEMNEQIDQNLIGRYGLDSHPVVREGRRHRLLRERQERELDDQQEAREHAILTPGNRRNPRLNPEPDSSRAEEIYEMWHQKEPHKVSVFKPGCDGQDMMVCIGKAQNVMYRSGKWEAGRKTNDYTHDFAGPSVYMLAHIAEPRTRQNPSKTVETLLRAAKNADGQYQVAELAAPLSFELTDGTDIAIHAGAKVYGCPDKKTILICDPSWKLIVVKGGAMFFDERGIVN